MAIIGDFIAVSAAAEKFSIHPIYSPATSDFNNMIATLGLLDIGFFGNQFIWSINRQGNAYVAARLDRSLTNQAWAFSFLDSYIQHLVRQNSDHSPILLSSRPPIIAKYIPFKFEEMWIGHSAFKELVAKAWSVPIYGNP